MSILKTRCERAFIAVVVLVAPFASLSALADGALAVGVPPDVVQQGFAYGINVNSPDEDTARQRALQNCQSTTEAPDTAKKFCTVVTTFRNQCAVVSMDPKAGTPGVGWAVASGLDSAEKQALDNCRATAGPDRTQFCEKSASACDGQ